LVDKSHLDLARLRPLRETTGGDGASGAAAEDEHPLGHAATIATQPSARIRALADSPAGFYGPVRPATFAPRRPGYLERRKGGRMYIGVGTLVIILIIIILILLF
jgi:hypothetical protein